MYTLAQNAAANVLSSLCLESACYTESDRNLFCCLCAWNLHASYVTGFEQVDDGDFYEDLSNYENPPGYVNLGNNNNKHKKPTTSPTSPTAKAGGGGGGGGFYQNANSVYVNDPYANADLEDAPPYEKAPPPPPSTLPPVCGKNAQTARAFFTFRDQKSVEAKSPTSPTSPTGGAVGKKWGGGGAGGGGGAKSPTSPVGGRPGSGGRRDAGGPPPPMVDIFKDANPGELYDDVDTTAPISPAGSRQSAVQQMLPKEQLASLASSAGSSPGGAKGGNSALSMTPNRGLPSQTSGGSGKGGGSREASSSATWKTSSSSSAPLRQRSVNSATSRPVSVNPNQGRSLPQTPGESAAKGRPVSVAAGRDSAPVAKETKEAPPEPVNVKDLRKLFQ